MSEVRGPVNVARMPEGQPVAQLAALGLARVSWGPFLYWDAMARFNEQPASLTE
jgi:2-methylisocitrate lyase-like PEP mutase family enzyme